MNPLRTFVLVLCCCLLAGTEPGEDQTMAIANGQIIRESEFMSGAARALFGPYRIQRWSSRLQQMVERTCISTRLRGLGIEVAPEAVERRYQQFIANPIAQACGCHFYRDLADYRQQNQLTDDEVRQLLWNDLAVRAYVQRKWEELNPGEAGKAALVTRLAPTMRVSYRRLWRIYIPSTDGEPIDPTDRSGPTWERAVQVRDLLRAKAPFAAVMRAYSTDPEAIERGGCDGIVPESAISNTGIARSDFETLPAGMASDPLINQYGYQIIRWEPITDAEMLEILRQEFNAQTTGDFHAQERQQRQVEYVGLGKQLTVEQPDPTGQ